MSKNEDTSSGVTKIAYNQNPVPFGVENHGVRVKHTEKARPFAKIRRTKIGQGRSIFIKCAYTLHRKFSQHEKN